MSCIGRPDTGFLVMEHAMNHSFSRRRTLKLIAGPNPLDPRVTGIWVTAISTILEPSTAASATTALARILKGGAFGAHGTAERLRSRHLL